MALDSTIQGGSSSAGKANVDANYNLQVNTPTNNDLAGFVANTFELDAGAITGARLMRAPDVSHDNRLSVGIDSQLAMFNFTPTTQNTGDFKHAFTTMTMTQNGGFLNINPALATVSGNYAYLQSWKYFTLQADGDMHIEIVGQVSAMPPTNQVFECGLFQGTAGVIPTDGVFFRLSASGLEGVLINNGNAFTTGFIIATVPANTNGKYQISVTQRHVCFWVNGVLGGAIETPAGYAVPYLTLNLPLCFMVRNTGTVTGGATVKIGTCHITQKDLNTCRPWAHQMSAQGNAYQGQEGDTMGSLAMYSNAAVAAAAALANATAAAPNIGLGGVVQVLPTLTAGTDGILLSYQNPAGSVTQPPKTLVVTGFMMDSAVTTILTGGPLIMAVGLAYGHNALTLATVETGSFVTATTKAPRRVPVGMQCYAATAAVGTTAQSIAVKFDSPLVVNPGEYFQVTVRNLGTVTTLGAVCFVVGIDHYFE
jgi:hypothetical protein